MNQRFPLLLSMGDSFRKVQSGEKLAVSAEAYNSFVDAARDVKARRHDRISQVGNELRQSGIIRVKNESGQARERFDVLAIEEPLIGPAANLDSFKQQVALIGVTPEEDNHEGKFAIVLEPLATGAIGKAVVSGVVQARVQIDDPEHEFADITEGDCGAPDAYFSSCADCAKCYQFTPCPGVVGPGFKCTNYFQPGKVYRTESGDCFTVSVADNCIGAANDCVFEVGPYEGCEVCNGTAKFVLCPANCEAEGGCCEQAEPPDPNDPESGCICTTADLSGSVGKLVKVNGRCHSVSRDDDFQGNCEGDVSGMAGPFADCRECLDYRQFYRRTYIGCPYVLGKLDQGDGHGVFGICRSFSFLPMRSLLAHWLSRRWRSLLDPMVKRRLCALPGIQRERANARAISQRLSALLLTS